LGAECELGDGREDGQRREEGDEDRSNPNL